MGAFLFALGMLAVVVYDMKLFTNMVASLPSINYKKWWHLLVCLCCNVLGIALVAVIARYSFLGDKIVSQASSIIGSRINADYWPIKSFCSAVMCGFLTTFSVLSQGTDEKSRLSGMLGVGLPVLAFAFCGFDHAIADILYIFYYGFEAFLKMPWQILCYLLLVIVGNIVGGIVYPLVLALEKRCKSKNK